MPRPSTPPRQDINRTTIQPRPQSVAFSYLLTPETIHVYLTKVNKPATNDLLSVHCKDTILLTVKPGNGTVNKPNASELNETIKNDPSDCVIRAGINNRINIPNPDSYRESSRKPIKRHQMNKNHSTKSYNPDNPQILAILIQTKTGIIPEHLSRQGGENHITSQKLPICNLFKAFLFFLLLPTVIL